MPYLKLASVLMFLAVALGAFGAHALKLPPAGKAVYQTGVLYHLVHGLALFGLGWLSSLKPAEPLPCAIRHLRKDYDDHVDGEEPGRDDRHL